MKLIETVFTANGFVHEQVQREGNLAIFRRFKQGGGPEHFETVRIRSHNGFQIGSMTEHSEPAEMYPSSEKWGTDGFTYPDIETARHRFSDMQKAEMEKASK